MRRILLVDDEPKILRLVGDFLAEAGHAVERCGTGQQAKGALDAEIFDLLITDVRLPDLSGIYLLEHARKGFPHIQVIVVTAYGTVPEAVRAMKLGAIDYLQKPFEMEALQHLVENALESTRLREENRMLRAITHREQEERGLIGTSLAIKNVLTLIVKVAPTPTTVLIQGESGTGKEVIAEAIHQSSLVAHRPLLRINCLAIPSELMEGELFGHMKGAFTGAQESRKGWFELASGGTLLLDEISGLPLHLQGKLLRVLEERCITRIGSSRSTPVDVRILAASNEDLRQQISQGSFREDLFYRLNVFPIHLPPLRERKDDIPELVEALLKQIVQRLGLPSQEVAPEVLEALAGYNWPGNVRELRNILERAAILAGRGTITLQHLPAELFEQTHGEELAPSDASFAQQVDRYKSQIILEALKATGWVKKDAAERLALTPRALSHYISKYTIDAQREELPARPPSLRKS
jgi:DNA-binding NtrC family response regulator